MSQGHSMTIHSVRSLGSKRSISHEDVIEISDSDDEHEEPCTALSEIHCGRLPAQQRRHVKVASGAKISNGDDAKRRRASLSISRLDSHGLHAVNSTHSDEAHGVVSGIASQNNDYSNQRVFRSCPNGAGTPTALLSRRPASSTTVITPSQLSESADVIESGNHGTELEPKGEGESPAGSGEWNAAASPAALELEILEGKEEPNESPIVDPSPVDENVRNQKQFLKPPVPKVALSKKDFQKMTLDDVNDLISKHGSHLIQKVTVKDIVEKGISEMKPPKNLKVTPQLHKKPQYKMPISADDEIIVISDDERVADSASLDVTSGSPPEHRSHTPEDDFKAKENFLANLQLVHDFKRKRPFKKDIYNVLRTRPIIKAIVRFNEKEVRTTKRSPKVYYDGTKSLWDFIAHHECVQDYGFPFPVERYIANPHVSLIKANCIYKYVTNKGFLSSEQFRARREAPRGRKKAAADTPRPKRAAPRAYPRVAPGLGIRRSIRKRAVRIANLNQSSKKHFLTAKLKQSISKHETEGVWTPYGISPASCSLRKPVIVLKRVDTEGTADEMDPVTRDFYAAQAKEFKCRWCPFICLNVPSLREHCIDYHQRLYPTVI